MLTNITVQVEARLIEGEVRHKMLLNTDNNCFTLANIKVEASLFTIYPRSTR